MSSAANRVVMGGGPFHHTAERDRDPLAPVVALGDRAAKTGTVIGLVLALLSHGYASAQAMTALFDMRRAVGEMRQGLHEFFWTEYDIDLTPKNEDKPKPEEKPPEPEPEPEAPPPVPQAKAEKAPEEEVPDNSPPPPPSQAAKVLTQEPDEEEPVDMTGQGFVSGEGSGPSYGMVSAQGTGKTPTYNKAASLDGKEGGTGTGKGGPPPAPTGPDLSKAAGLVGSSAWDCPFPPEADAEQIDQAVVSIIVTVRGDGSPQSVKVVNDPGYGFGRAARLCALSRRYTPALDRTGTPMVAATPPIRVRFTR
ncbi:energy transducer TonB [Polyangium sorediatum]|uniref:Energy transducer TonB n=1 Tax=Polyangium sorediatum TaxID=889274 RepID=A0ABT6P5V4_9BACT|nr:energy transducer TonB [Polyangium sorediatum]MDI1435987.1 energy transducer TonB [Polyangium sorediatum]